jgi:hypothetical protein
MPPRGYELPFFRRDRLELCREPGMCLRIHRPVFDIGTGRVIAKKVIAFPVFRRSDRSGYESAPAVWADIAQDGINASSAERAFISTDSCFK